MNIIELRIGNYVRIEKQIYTVDKIKGSGFITAMDAQGNIKINIPVDGVKPVLITTGWLEKLSLSVSFENEHYSIYDFGDTAFGLTFDYAKGSDKFNITFEGNQMKTIHYVHKLQNFQLMFCDCSL